MTLSFARTTWRLVLSDPADGAWNMAVDLAILEAAGRRAVPPTLRLYSWMPACLSLGYAQPYRDADPAALQANGWDIVRRPTGGRAILHTDELTYSVAGPPDEPRLSGSVLESYRVLAQVLLNALQRLDIPAQALEKPAARVVSPRPAAGPAVQNPVCFEIPSNYEITVAGRKLIGSAQARRKEGVLQHGSLPLSGDLRRVTQALAFPDEAARQSAARRLQECAVTAEEILGHAPTWNTAAQAFAAAFRETLNLDLQPGELTTAETVRAQTLLAEQFANPVWTKRN